MDALTWLLDVLSISVVWGRWMDGFITLTKEGFHQVPLLSASSDLRFPHTDIHVTLALQFGEPKIDLSWLAICVLR